MIKMSRDPYHINYEEYCVNPFCLNYKLPDELGLCNECYNELARIIGQRKIYDYSGKKPKLLITIKEALEKLIANGKGGCSFRRLRFDDEPCLHCRESQNEVTEKRNLNSSNRQKMR
jgi:hypothetical protein